jgi:hypothetical protein
VPFQNKSSTTYFLVEDAGRLARRTVISSVAQWRREAEPAAPVIETPVYRKEYGLWEHQKYFVQAAFEAHRRGGARIVLADMVGLGKTVQLALSAQLMALYGSRPVLVLAPKPLLWQWQDEMRNLLDMPSAVWTGRQWVDENGIEYLPLGPEGIKKCPRRVGVVSQGLVTSRSEAVEYLKQISFECIIVDEAHRARRKNLGPGKEDEKLEDAIRLPAYLREAYDLAGEFCELLGNRVKAAGFLNTLLLRRVGSTIYAGKETAEKMLRDWQAVVTEEKQGW